jgi:hypothetical protein
MVDKIDTEIDRQKSLEQIPNALEVGDAVYEELYWEHNQVAADLVAPGQPASVHSLEEVTEYEGIRVVRMIDESKDYFNVLT